MDTENFCTFAVIVIIFCCLSCFIGVGCQESKFQRIAIENNAAEWTINKQTGEKKFEWIKNK